MSILTQLTAEEFGTAQHIAPLIVTAEFHVAAVFLVQHIEIIALHDHVVEFKEGKTLFHSLLVALCSQHVVNTEAGTHFS